MLNLEFGILVRSYFDDFPIVSPEPLADFFLKSTTRVLNLLGWKVKTPTREAADPSTSLDSLGVTFGFEDLARGTLQLRNKPGRVGQIETEVLDILSGNAVRPAVLASLHGKVRYCRSQLFPRAGAGHLGTMVRWMYARGAAVRLTPELVAACRWWPLFLASSRPREVKARDNPKPVLVFTMALAKRRATP